MGLNRSAVHSLVAMGIVLGAGATVIAHDDGRALAHEAFRDQRRSIDRDFDREEDALRERFKAIRKHEEEIWKQQRRYAAPHDRKHLDRQYRQRRKMIERDYDVEREALDHLEDQLRAAVKDEYRQSLRYDVPRHVELYRYDIPFEDVRQGPAIYDDRAAPVLNPPTRPSVPSYELIEPARPR